MNNEVFRFFLYGDVIGARRTSLPRTLHIPIVKSRTAFIVVVAIVTGTVVGFIALRTAGQDLPAHALRPNDVKVLAAGERVYAQRCASCHGAQLEGQPEWRSRGADGLLPAPPHDASGHTWHHPDELLFRITKFGVAKAANLSDYKSAMPAYEGVLSDEEIVAVLSWIKSRWPMSVREQHNQLNAQSLKEPKQ
ncbi:MAG: cytochrome c [Burkholderiaceae bacterium]